MYVVYLFIIDILFILFLIDPDIDSQQVVNYDLKILLERMLIHLKIPNVLSQNFLETDRRFCFYWIISALSKELCGSFKSFPEILRIFFFFVLNWV